jgi:hypothetical protein
MDLHQAGTNLTGLQDHNMAVVLGLLRSPWQASAG